MKFQLTLENVISGRVCDPEEGWVSRDIVLTEKQKASFVYVFGKGCTEKRKRDLRDFIENARNRKSYGIYGRVYFYDETRRYCAGQDYPSEIALVRKLACGW